MRFTSKGRPNGLATLDENGQLEADQVPSGGAANITAEDITDATTVGKAVMTAADATAGRTAIGAGTSDLALGTTVSTAAAGNHTHAGLSADQAAATPSIRTLGTGAAQAAAGNHTHTGLTADQAAATPSIRTLGTAATQAAAGNHTHAGLMTGSAAAVNNSVAADTAAMVTDFNALLAALRTRGIITGA